MRDVTIPDHGSDCGRWLIDSVVLKVLGSASIRRIDLTEGAVITPDELAKRLGWSARRLKDLARRLGACRILGNRMIMTHDDVATIMEATRCRSKSTSGGKSGTIAGQLPVGGYEGLLALRQKTLRNKSRPGKKAKPGNVICTDRKRS